MHALSLPRHGRPPAARRHCVQRTLAPGPGRPCSCTASTTKKTPSTEPPNPPEHHHGSWVSSLHLKLVNAGSNCLERVPPDGVSAVGVVFVLAMWFTTVATHSMLPGLLLLALLLAYAAAMDPPELGVRTSAVPPPPGALLGAAVVSWWSMLCTQVGRAERFARRQARSLGVGLGLGMVAYKLVGRPPPAIDTPDPRHQRQLADLKYRHELEVANLKQDIADHKREVSDLHSQLDAAKQRLELLHKAEASRQEASQKLEGQLQEALKKANSQRQEAAQKVEALKQEAVQKAEVLRKEAVQKAETLRKEALAKVEAQRKQALQQDEQARRKQEGIWRDKEEMWKQREAMWKEMEATWNEERSSKDVEIGELQKKLQSFELQMDGLAKVHQQELMALKTDLKIKEQQLQTMAQGPTQESDLVVKLEAQASANAKLRATMGTFEKQMVAVRTHLKDAKVKQVKAEMLATTYEAQLKLLHQELAKLQGERSVLIMQVKDLHRHSLGLVQAHAGSNGRSK